MEKVDRVIKYFRSLREDAPTANVGSGKIAGTSESGDDPPVFNRKKKKKYIYGPRKVWLDHLKDK